jgi:hypothetical protein
MRMRALAGVLLVAAPAWVASQRGAPAGGRVSRSETRSCKTLAVCISPNDTTRPPRLEGPGGQPPAYDFIHTADVNESASPGGRKFTYEHQIQNKNPDGVLWAEWTDGNISFQMVPPCGCAPGYRESGTGPREKPDSEIRYGQAKQFPQSPQPTSAYVLQGQESSTPPSLMTKLFARLADFVADVIFTTEALPGNRFRYTVQNKSTGAGTVLFSIPSVMARWAQFQPLGQALQGSAWQTAGQPITPTSLFLAPADSLAVWSVAAPPGTVLREESAQISIFLNNQDRLLASGVVSVYLPVRPG